MQYAKTNPEPVSERTPTFRNIHFANITGQVNQAAYLNGLEEMPISNITFNDINLEAKSGFSISNATDIELHNVSVNTQIGAAVKALKVNNLIIDGLKSNKIPANAAVVDLTNVSDLFLYNAFPSAEINNYLKLSGAETKNIFLGNNNFRRIKTPVKKEKEVTATIEIISGDKGQ
ncbi:Glycosyl hydrolases family 28 [compost metagenome]